MKRYLLFLPRYLYHTIHLHILPKYPANHTYRNTSSFSCFVCCAWEVFSCSNLYHTVLYCAYCKLFFHNLLYNLGPRPIQVACTRAVANYCMQWTRVQLILYKHVLYVDRDCLHVSGLLYLHAVLLSIFANLWSLSTCLFVMRFLSACCVMNTYAIQSCTLEKLNLNFFLLQKLSNGDWYKLA
jgi:hypothetical protein